MFIKAKILAFAVRQEWRRQRISTGFQKKAISRARELNCYQVRSYSSNTFEHEANYQLKLPMGFTAQPEFRGEQNTGVNFLMPLSLIDADDE